MILAFKLLYKSNRILTPFNADLAAALALPVLPFAAAPIKTYASAIALEELAISAAAGAHGAST
jgi:hypothetical protein